MTDGPGKREQMVGVFARYEAERLGFPTVRALGAEVGLTSSSTIHAHLAQLVRTGVLEVVPGTAGRFRDTRYRLVLADVLTVPCPTCGGPVMQ